MKSISSVPNSNIFNALTELRPLFASLSARLFPILPLWPLTLWSLRSKLFALQQLLIWLNRLLFFVLKWFLSLLILLYFSIASIATLLSVNIYTWVSIGIASKAVQIAPNSAWVEEGQFSMLSLKLILLSNLFSVLAI